MGVAVNNEVIAVGAHNQVWFLRASPGILANLKPPGHHDAAFLTRRSQYTGDIHCHDQAWIGSELWIVNTLFSCLCTLDPEYNFAPRWWPPFITSLTAEDRCHLNGLAASEGQPRYVTVMAEADTKQGWRPLRKTGGCVIDVASGTTVARGLMMPHSPRLANGKLYVLNSGFGCLEVLNPSNGQRDVVCDLPGYTRGLAVAGSLAFVGLSKVRTSSDWEGVPIADHPERLKCGVWVVDLNRGTPIGHFEFTSGANELFEVQVLRGVSRPFISGPLEANPIWKVKPWR
jgi:uncharacterized protein (TIGR03032 family)